MQATRILPDLQCSLVCEEVRQEANGNFFLVGVINFIRGPQLPVVAYKLSVFNRWTAGIGQFTECVRLIAPDQTTVLRKGEVKFNLRGPDVTDRELASWLDPYKGKLSVINTASASGSFVTGFFPTRSCGV